MTPKVWNDIMAGPTADLDRALAATKKDTTYD